MKNATHKPKKPSSSSTRSKASARQTAKTKKPRERVVSEVSAGGIVFRPQGRGMQFAIMKDSYDKWAFPKGHVEKGESLEEAAARETLEELGLREIRLIDYLGKIDIWFRDRFEKRGALIHKDIHYFLFAAHEQARLDPDPSQHAYDAKWVGSKKILDVSSYPDMVPVLTRALEMVKGF